jgi:hypothetical protein
MGGGAALCEGKRKLKPPLSGVLPTSKNINDKKKKKHRWVVQVRCGLNLSVR